MVLSYFRGDENFSFMNHPIDQAPWNVFKTSNMFQRESTVDYNIMNFFYVTSQFLILSVDQAKL